MRFVILFALLFPVFANAQMGCGGIPPKKDKPVILSPAPPPPPAPKPH